MIEASSPLAAMQPPAFMGHYGFRADAPPSYLSLAASKNFGPNSFNFKDLSMKKSMQRSQSDYFSMRPVRGSSPTASLAADLSQNFHIDQSPQLPTPRRSLFSSNVIPAHKSHVNLTTPPIPSSSPGVNDAMDMDFSPLPHKAPYGAIELQLQSPTPELTPADASMLSVPSPPSSDSIADNMQLFLPSEKRKSGPLRPSLSRAKCLSSGAIPQRAAPEVRLPPFKFGNFASKPAASSSLSLSEIFEQSPVQEKQQPRVGGSVMPLPRPRQPFGVLASGSRNGSPVGQHVRKVSNSSVRPRKLFRRSLSMYEHPEDVMKQERESMNPLPLPSIMDVEAPHVPQLPHFHMEDQAGDLPRISKETMVRVLDGDFNHVYEKLVIVDCRFEYEYRGGHIDGAINFNDKEQLSAQLFDIEPTTKALLIFHCEYSVHRAPLMAKFIRNKDRTINADRYPGLTYPEAYILNGGYSSFFKDYQSRCFPQNYVEMDAKEHVFACERGLGKVKQRSKLIRAQTFAFGQHSPQLDSSPTAMSRSRVDDDMDMDLSLNYTPAPLLRPGIDAFRGRNQRMLSY